MKKVLLKPCDDGHGGTLIDILIDGIGWCGSRRTIRQCEVFLEKKEEEVNQENKPSYDTHIKMRQCLLTFGEKWWYNIFQEIQRRESHEGSSNSRIQRR